MKNIHNFVQGVLARRHFDALGLGYIVDHVHDNNPGNGNQYHNSRHMVNVAVLCRDLWFAETHPGADIKALRALIIAALWHDFGHSGGKLADLENIEIAVAAMREFCKVREDEWTIKRAEALIRVTEFPFVHQPVSLSEMIIRDADLLYMYNENTGAILHDLYSELKDCGKLAPDFTFDQIVAAQEQFMETSTMFTRTAKDIKELTKTSVLEVQQMYAMVLPHLKKD